MWQKCPICNGSGLTIEPADGINNIERNCIVCEGGKIIHQELGISRPEMDRRQHKRDKMVELGDLEKLMKQPQTQPQPYRDPHQPFQGPFTTPYPGIGIQPNHSGTLPKPLRLTDGMVKSEIRSPLMVAEDRFNGELLNKGAVTRKITREEAQRMVEGKGPLVLDQNRLKDYSEQRALEESLAIRKPLTPDECFPSAKEFNDHNFVMRELLENAMNAMTQVLNAKILEIEEDIK